MKKTSRDENSTRFNYINVSKETSKDLLLKIKKVTSRVLCSIKQWY